ncbi:Large neutral amino acids transporter small subunit 2 [Trichostrongylus colubriformis]|uniref:Large neutral amino acids transporter small subunit 2 n=1 Tax=Trichostrongylus colubriformis TaxID=6319 RepID=A0AAN8G2V4_TRICO
MTRKEVNRIGVLGATSYIIGSVIGSGIFVSPKGILEHAGSVGLSLVIWVGAAALASLTAINYIELGTSIPESGAEFAYISYVKWYPIAFSFLWLATLIQCSCGGATLALTFGEYIMESISPITCLSPENRRVAVLLIAYGILLSTSLLNMFSLSRVAGRIQFVSMVAKVAALMMIIGIGLFYIIFKGSTQHFSKDYIFKGSKWSPSQIVLALYQGNWAYGGYTILNYGMEDIQIKNFKRTVPVAVLFGLFVSSFVYVLANVAYFAVLTPQQILDSPAVATTFAQDTIGSFSYAMPALIGFLMLGSVNAEIFAWSRWVYFVDTTVFKMDGSSCKNT